MTPEDRLKAMGLTLPAMATPVANYVPFRMAGNLLFISGQGPKQPDGSYNKGRLGKTMTIEEGYQEARLTGLYLLAVAKAALGDLSRIEAVVKLLGMVNAEPISPTTPKSSMAALTSSSRFWARPGGMPALPWAWGHCPMAWRSRSKPFCWCAHEYPDHEQSETAHRTGVWHTGHGGRSGCGREEHCPRTGDL